MGITLLNVARTSEKILLFCRHSHLDLEWSLSIIYYMNLESIRPVNSLSILDFCLAIYIRSSMRALPSSALTYDLKFHRCVVILFHVILG